MTAARRANVPATEVARILVHGRSVNGSRNPPRIYAEAIHSLPYFLACAVADKDFTWIHARRRSSTTRPSLGSWAWSTPTRRRHRSSTNGTGAARSRS